MIIKILRIVASLFGAISALFIAQKFNFFQYLPFVPEGKAYDVCITIYFTIVECLISFLFEFIGKLIETSKVYVTCMCFTDFHNISISNIPFVTFDDMDIARLSVRVSIKGNTDKLKSRKIRIRSMSQVDFQIEHSGTSMKLDKNGDIVINLTQMCGNQKEVYLNENFAFKLIRNISNANAECILNPSIEGNSIFLVFRNNSAKIKMGGNV